MSQLPVDILNLIFSYLDKASHIRLRRVCLRYSRIIRKVTNMFTRSIYERQASDYICSTGNDGYHTVIRNWLQNITQGTIDHNPQIEMLDISMIRNAVSRIILPNLLVLKSRCDPYHRISPNCRYMPKLRVIIDVLPDNYLYGALSKNNVGHLFKWDWRRNIIVVRYDTELQSPYNVFLEWTSPYIVHTKTDILLIEGMCITSVQICRTGANSDVLKKNDDLAPYVLIIDLGNADSVSHLKWYNTSRLKCLMVLSKSFSCTSSLRCRIEELRSENMAPNLEELYIIYYNEEDDYTDERDNDIYDEDSGMVISDNRDIVNIYDIKYVKLMWTHTNYKHTQKSNKDYIPSCLRHVKDAKYVLTFEDMYQLCIHFKIPMKYELIQLFKDLGIIQ